MLVFEFKAYGKQQQFDAVDEALRTVQFIRNKAIRFNLGNACGEVISTDVGEILYQQIASMNQESQWLQP